jgi:hypothetical protein
VNGGSIRIFPPGTLITTLELIANQLRAVIGADTWAILSGSYTTTGTGGIQYMFQYYTSLAGDVATFNTLLGYLPVIRNIGRQQRQRPHDRMDTTQYTNPSQTRGRSRSRHTTNTDDAIRDRAPVIPPYIVVTEDGRNASRTRSNDAELRVGLLDQPRELSPAIVLVPHNRLPEKEL